MPSGLTDVVASSTNNTFSGSDIRAYIGPVPFGQMQAISYSISREKAPIYTCGSPDPRSFSRNKRGIAGSLVWVMFDRHALLALVAKLKGTFLANRDDINPAFLAPIAPSGGYVSPQVFSATMVTNAGALPQPVGSAAASQPLVSMNTAANFKVVATPSYSDQILPFDVTMAAANEYGAAMGMKIFGVEILNEGYGISVDDTVSEMQATFVARSVEPWQAVATGLSVTQ